VPLRSSANGFPYVLGLCLAIFLHPLFAAERPELTRLLPSGGQAGTDVQIEATGKFPVWPLQTWSSTDAIRWTCGEKTGNLQAHIASDATPGLHWLRLYHETGATAVRPFLVGTVPEQLESEPNNRVQEANEIVFVPTNVHAVLAKSRDVDFYSVSMIAGQCIVATVDASNGLKSPIDASLQWIDPSGFVVAENLDHFGLDPSLRVIAKQDGKAILKVFGFPAAPDSTIAFGGGADWVYRLRIENRTDTPTAALQQLPGLTNAVTLELKPDIALDRDSAISVELPASIRGAIEKTKQSRYLKFMAKKDKDYRVLLSAREHGSELDGVLTIVDAGGKQLVQKDVDSDHRDPDLKWKAPADGEYFLEIHDFHRAGGADYPFQLSIWETFPNYNLTVMSDLVRAIVGKETEIEINVTRELGFSGEIDVSVAGLPDGAICPPLKSVNGSETEKKLSIRLKCDTKTQCPISIVAKSSNQAGEIVRAATTEGSKPLWLSVEAEMQ